MLPACCSSCVKFIFKNLTLCMVLEKSRLPSHSTRQIFDWRKKFDQTPHSQEPFNIFSLICSHRTDDPGWILNFVRGFTILPSTERYLLVNKSKMAYTSRVTIHPCNHIFVVQKFRWLERSHHVVKFTLQNFRRSCCSYCANKIADQTGLRFYLESSIQIFEGLGVKLSYG